jgi:cytoskeletal protein RodZ
MKHKEDIGTLLEKKLQGVQKTADKALWERVSNTLEENKKKRRKSFWFWFVSLGLLGIITLLNATALISIFNKNYKELEPKENYEISDFTEYPPTLEKPEENKDPNSVSEILTEDGSISELQMTLSEAQINTKPSSKTNNTSVQKVKQIKNTKGIFTEDEYTVKTTYYYYLAIPCFLIEF